MIVKPVLFLSVVWDFIANNELIGTVLHDSFYNHQNITL